MILFSSRLTQLFSLIFDSYFFIFFIFQSHGNSSLGSEASGVSPAQSTDGYDQDEQHLDQVRNENIINLIQLSLHLSNMIL